jgi:hypothetical protein
LPSGASSARLVVELSAEDPSPAEPDPSSLVSYPFHSALIPFFFRRFTSVYSRYPVHAPSTLSTRSRILVIALHCIVSRTSLSLTFASFERLQSWRGGRASLDFSLPTLHNLSRSLELTPWTVLRLVSTPPSSQRPVRPLVALPPPTSKLILFASLSPLTATGKTVRLIGKVISVRLYLPLRVDILQS